MKTIIYFILGIISGILTFKFGISAFRTLVTFNLLTCVLDIFITCGLGLLTIKIFEKI